MEANTQGPSDQRPPRRWLRRLGLTILILILVPFLFLLTLGPAGGAVLSTLTTGWISFLDRTLPAISWNWDLIGMAALCSVLIVLLGQWLLSRLVQSIATARGTTWRWRWRWTWGGLVIIAVSFLVGMAVGGIAHQVGWMVSSDEPLYERKSGFLYDEDVQQLHDIVMASARGAAGDLDQIREFVRSRAGGWRGRFGQEGLLLERFRIFLLQDASGAITGTIIVPRVKDQRERWGFHSTENRPQRFLAEDLPFYIREYGEHMIALL